MRDRDKLKDNAIAHLADQLMPRLDSIEVLLWFESGTIGRIMDMIFHLVIL
jgi:molecular chaperone GrpE (heat shock protein)